MTTVDTVEPIAQLDVTIDAQFRAWIGPQRNLQPPLLIVGAGVSPGLVPRAIELVTAMGARKGEIEVERQIAAGQAISPECESDLCAWVSHRLGELVRPTGWLTVAAQRRATRANAPTPAPTSTKPCQCGRLTAEALRQSDPTTT